MQVLFLALYALLARVVIASQSLWLDEAIGAIVVKTLSFRDILLEFPLADNHPPLYYLVLKAWTVVFGYSEVSLRFPSIIFGVLTVVFVYKISKRFTKINPIVPAILLATSPLHIYYSQEAKMYCLAAFLATVTIYYFLKVIQSESNFLNWFFFSIFYTLLAFSDYVPIFLYPMFVIYPLIRKLSREWWKKFIFSNIPLVILGFVWLPMFIVQSQKGKWLLNTLPAWRDIAGGANLRQLAVFWSKLVLGRISLYDKGIYYGLVFLASIPVLLLLFQAIRKCKGKEIYWFWFTVPIVLGFVASVIFPAFIYFRFIFVLPAFYLLVACGASGKRAFSKFLIGAILVFNILGWGIYVFDKNQQREDWKGAVSYIESVAGSNDVVIFENPEPFAPYRWYWSGKVKSVGVLDSILANKDKTLQIVTNALKNERGVYYFEYLKDLQDPLGIVQRGLAENGYIETGRKSFNGVGFIICYQKKGAYAYRY